MKSMYFQDAVESSSKVIGRKDVRVVFEGDRAETDGDTVYLPALPPAAEISVDQADIIRGFRDHESMHVRCTSTNKETMKRLQELADTKKKEFSLVQTCEDIRIENAGISEYVGMKKSLTAVQTHAGKMLLEQIESKGDAAQVIASLPKQLQARILLQSIAREKIGVTSGGVFNAINEHIKAADPKLFDLCSKLTDEMVALPTGMKGNKLNESESRKGTDESFALASRILTALQEHEEQQQQQQQQQPDPQQQSGTGDPDDQPCNGGNGGEDADQPQDRDGGQQQGDGQDDGQGNSSSGGQGGGEDEDDASGSQQSGGAGSGSGGDGDDDPSDGQQDGGQQSGGGGGQGSGNNGSGNDAGGSGHSDGMASLDDSAVKDIEDAVDDGYKNAIDDVVSKIIDEPHLTGGGRLMRSLYRPMTTKFSQTIPAVDAICHSRDLSLGDRNRQLSYAERVMTEIEKDIGGAKAMIRRLLELELQAMSDRRWENGHKSGRLQSVRLVDAVQGRESVYQRRESGRDMNTILLMDIDASGSMNKSSRIEAVKLAYALAEALERTGCEIKVLIWGDRSVNKSQNAPTARYSNPEYEDFYYKNMQHYRDENNVQRPPKAYKYTSSGVLTRGVVKDKRQRTGSKEVRQAFGMFANYSLDCGTPTFDAVFTSLRELGKEPHAKKIYLHLTDGDPNGVLNDVPAKELMQEAQALATSLNIHMVGVGVAGQDVKHLFRDYVNVSGVEAYEPVIKRMAKLIAEEAGHAATFRRAA